MDNALFPRIFVECLQSKDDGILHGEWISIGYNTITSDVHTAIRQLLEDSPVPNATEWGITDYRNFGELRIDIHDSLTDVLMAAKQIILTTWNEEDIPVWHGCPDRR